MKAVTFFMPLVLILMIGSLNPPIFVIGAEIKQEKVPISFEQSYSKQFDKLWNFTLNVPDLPEFVNTNLTDFTPNGTTVFTGDDILSPVSGSFFKVDVNITRLEIIDDHDGGLSGAGEIFVEGLANGNYSRYPSIGNEFSINSGETITTNINLLSTIASTLNVTLEIRESDTGSDDSLGLITFASTTLANTTLTLTTDIGDAIVDLTITVYPYSSITANEFLNGYKPFLYVDDESNTTELPDQTLGRIIQGSENGKNVLVLQYYMYWETENAPQDTFETHKNDFEVVLVYLDLADLSEPYRVVFNSWQYTDFTDFPAEDILVLDKGVTTPSTEESITVIDNRLQPLLGSVAIQKAKTMPFDEIRNWEYDSLLNLRKNALRTSLMGYNTIDLTVDTSYHTFDLGPGGTQYGYDYPVDALTDAVLKDWFLEINETFNLGTKIWSAFGVDVPVVAPFTHDVTQVFTFPYLISGYHNVVEEAGAITRARNSQVLINQTLTVDTTFRFEGNLVIDYLSTAQPGSTGNMNITLDLDPNNFFVDLGYTYLMNTSLSYFFIQSVFLYNTSQTMSLNIPLETVNSLLDRLGYGSYSMENQPLASFVELEHLTLKPELVGTIANGSLNVQLWGIITNLLKTAVPEAIALIELADRLIDALTLSIGFLLETLVRADIAIETPGVTAGLTSLEFSETSKTVTVPLTYDSNADLSQGISVNFSNINLDMDFSVNWGLGVYFTFPISKLIEKIEWDIGSFPSLTSNLVSSEDQKTDLDVEVPTTSTTSSTSSSNPPTSEPTTPVASETPQETTDFLGLVLLPIPVAMIRKQRKR
ncbi:MAG: hypothetical protein D6732_21965 [Methanobacteriota archaeon]|nr:MAG: hypothetical protein D6732_21965 [Euryarchaeota archaeon]